MAVYLGVLHGELNKLLPGLGLERVKCEPGPVAAGLVEGLRESGKECVVINKAMRSSVVDCFDREQGNKAYYEQTDPHRKQIIGRIEQILGYLVLSLVNEKDAEAIDWLTGDLADLYFELHATTKGGVELFISHRKMRQAQLTLDGREVTGKHLIFVDTSPLSWHEAGRLDEIRLSVWNRVFDEERRTPLDDDAIAELKAELLTLRTIERDPRNYCIAIRFDDDGDVSYRKTCSDLLSELEIPMVRFGLKGRKPAFDGLEHNLMSAVRQFLITINSYVTP